MASATLVSVSDYLQNTYRPDREYIYGELRERNVGKWLHARIQIILAAWFYNHEESWTIISSTEQRMRVAASRIRIPDLVVLRPCNPPDMLTDPPLLVVEILSPDDTYAELQSRFQDYLAMGRRTIWMIEPETRTGRMCLGDRWLAADRLEVAGTPIYLDLPELVRQIDRPVRRPAA